MSWPATGAGFFREGRRDRFPHRQRHPDHRLQFSLAAGAGKGHSTVEGVGVGERQVGQPILMGAGGELSTDGVAPSSVKWEWTSRCVKVARFIDAHYSTGQAVGEKRRTAPMGA